MTNEEKKFLKKLGKLMGKYRPYWNKCSLYDYEGNYYGTEYFFSIPESKDVAIRIILSIERC